MPTICRPAPPRLHAGGDPRLLRAHRRRQARERRSTSALLEHSVREDLNRRAPRVMAVLRPLKVVIDELPRGPGRGGRRRQQPGGRRRPARARCRSRACSTSSRTTSARTRRRSSSAWRRAARCGCATPTSSRARERRQGRDGRGRRAALHLRPGDARRRRAGRPQGEGDAALGVGGARRRRPRCGSTIACSPSRTPATRRRRLPRRSSTRSRSRC